MTQGPDTEQSTTPPGVPEGDEQVREELRVVRRQLAAANRVVKSQHAQLSAAKTKLDEANKRLRRFASTDSLTGLYNRRYFKVIWRRELTRARRYGEPLGMMVISIDGFDRVRQSHGREAADAVLREFGQVLLRSVRTVDLVARNGPNEFVVSLPRTEKDSVVMLAERLRGWVLEHDFPHSDVLPDGRLTVSVGVAAFPTDGDTAIAVMSRAASALKRSVSSGESNVSLVADAVVE
jgi:diguanylate cyclase (GGDEF)-like protein